MLQTRHMLQEAAARLLAPPSGYRRRYGRHRKRGTSRMASTSHRPTLSRTNPYGADIGRCPEGIRGAGLPVGMDCNK